MQIVHPSVRIPASHRDTSAITDYPTCVASSWYLTAGITQPLAGTLVSILKQSWKLLKTKLLHVLHP
jgi:hypothetical protein